MSGILRRLLSFLPFAGTRQKDVRYETFLHKAVQEFAELSVIEFLLDVSGAEINARTKMTLRLFLLRPTGITLQE